MVYLWLKALHVGAVLVFLGGLGVLAVTAASLARSGGMASPLEEGSLLAYVHRWDLVVTSPALGLVWGLGLALAWQGHWFSAPWLMVKVLIVVFLSALHGMMSGMVRRAGGGSARPMPSFVRYAPAAVVASAVAIAILVVVKPFGP